MSKNLTRKGLALVSGAALALTSLVGVAAPASAAAGDSVKLAVQTGTGYNVFVQDTLKVKAKMDPTVINSAFFDDLHWRISGIDSVTASIDVTVSTANMAFDAGTGNASSGDEVCTASFDYQTFDANDQPVANATVTIDSETGTYADLNACLALTTISQAPKPIPVASNVSYVVVEPGAYNLNAATGSATALVGTDSVNELGISLLDADDDWGDGDVTAQVDAWIETDADVTTVDGLLTKTETINFFDPKDVAAISTVERVVGDPVSNAVAFAGLLQSTDQFLTGSLRFSKTVNLDQVNLTKWKYQVSSTETSSDLASANIDTIVSAEVLTTNGNLDIVVPAGYSATNKTAYGKLLFKGALKTINADLLAGETYKVGFKHGDSASTTVLYESPGFQVSNTAATALAVESSVTDSSNLLLGTETVSARVGTQPVVYTAQLTTGDVNGGGTVDAGDDVALETANVPVLAVVTAGDVLPTGDSLVVSGTTSPITKPQGAVITTGLTNADGKWSVTVTSTNGKAGQTYTVDFFALKADDTWTTVRKVGDNSSKFTTTYVAPTVGASEFTVSTSVLNGASPTVTVSVKDQFGAPISASSAGSAYSVELKAPIKTNLELFASVVGGSATFTFDNYLPASQSDVLTAKLFTGSSTSPTYVSAASETITLYNSANSAAVVVPEELTGAIVTYDDFITGTADATTNVAPNDNSFVFTGSVVDSNGSGIPGAPVTLAAEGFQFQVTSGDYFKDSITLAASSAGTFQVNVWTHKASATGTAVTVTSGTLSDTTLVKSAIRGAALSAADLSFSWDLPSAVVVNTTYAVGADVTDKWGNPVTGAKVRFNGFGAALFNGSDTDVDKITDRNGNATVYLRSLKDVNGLSAVGATLVTVATADGAPSNVADLATVFTDAKGTVWDESLWTNSLASEVTFLDTAPASTSGQKVNAGSFKGYVALYALGYEGQRMSAKVGNDWVIVPAIPEATNDLFRAVEFVGAGVEISVRLYIDRVLVATIPLLTK